MIDPIQRAIKALVSAQLNIAASRGMCSSDDAFMWDYYQAAIDGLRQAEDPVAVATFDESFAHTTWNVELPNSGEAALFNHGVYRAVWRDAMETLKPALDYVQTHDEDFGLLAGDNKLETINRVFMEAVAPKDWPHPTLSHYGRLVRTLRLIAGVTLMDMYRQTDLSPAYLSARECRRAVPSEEDIQLVSAFFGAHGLSCGVALRRAVEVDAEGNE